MKKLLLLGIFIPSVSFALTQQQAQQASTAVNQIINDGYTLSRYTAYVNGLIANNWNDTVQYSTNTVTLTSDQQNDIVAEYLILKSKLVTDFGQLP